MMLNEKALVDVKPIMGDIVTELKWSKIARNYFGKSSSWIYNKLLGIDGNGGVGGFTEKETEVLRNALLDYSERLRAAAMKL